MIDGNFENENCFHSFVPYFKKNKNESKRQDIERCRRTIF